MAVLVEIFSRLLSNTQRRGLFQLVADDEGHAVDGGEQGAGVTLHMNGVVAGDGLAVGQEFALQPADTSMVSPTLNITWRAPG